MKKLAIEIEDKQGKIKQHEKYDKQNINSVFQDSLRIYYVDHNKFM